MCWFAAGGARANARVPRRRPEPCFEPDGLEGWGGADTKGQLLSTSGNLSIFCRFFLATFVAGFATGPSFLRVGDFHSGETRSPFQADPQEDHCGENKA